MNLKHSVDVKGDTNEIDWDDTLFYYALYSGVNSICLRSYAPYDSIYLSFHRSLLCVVSNVHIYIHFEDVNFLWFIYMFITNCLNFIFADICRFVQYPSRRQTHSQLETIKNSSMSFLLLIIVIGYFKNLYMYIRDQ